VEIGSDFIGVIGRAARVRDRRADQSGLGQARPVKLRYTLRAAEELDQVLSYIDKHSPQGVDHVKARIKAITNLIALHPLAASSRTHAAFAASSSIRIPISSSPRRRNTKS
jgi:hypothetical protein